ncbi:DNA cytosine methyltransferase [Stenoxybacter acetivorans]|uniref:DNA cytosine methyltransferase n=1 Tax=Stenoxybacter acetivorans TaxID=422441 RepID=UPI00068DCDF8|nr:DNA cytosine methyltransferase [Stenoxybacter acetivorans]
MSKIYTAVDLFAGAGGLSHGFLQSGYFRFQAAFENNADARATYQCNHPNVAVYGDVDELFTEEMKQRLGKIDVVIGGPPCQGFSNANRQRSQLINQNNNLVKKFIQSIAYLQPTALVMENVAAFLSPKHRFYLSELDFNEIESFGIKIHTTNIHLLERNYFCNDIIKILNEPEKLQQYFWQDNEYSVLNIIYHQLNHPQKLAKALHKYQHQLIGIVERFWAFPDTDSVWQSYHKMAVALRDYLAGAKGWHLAPTFKAAVLIQRCFLQWKELQTHQIVTSNLHCNDSYLSVNVSYVTVADYTLKYLEFMGYQVRHGILATADFGTPQKRNRLLILGIKTNHTAAAQLELPKGLFNEANYRTVGDAIDDIANITPTTDCATGNQGMALNKPTQKLSSLAQILRDSDYLYNHVITASREVALQRFAAIKQGDNFHNLANELKSTYAQPERTQNTIYLRLDRSKPCGTVVNVRKSMWIHPQHHRAISIREAARLQTFPDSFVFCGKKDAQYQQVGNAVPPIFAQAVAEYLGELLGKN